MKRIIQSHYDYYINNVSHDKIAISFELSCFIWDFLCKFRPSSIFERGTGFSSFVLNLYKSITSNSVYIYAFDTDKKWGSNTVNYLQVNNLYLINDFSTKYSLTENFPNSKFDLIFEDTKTNRRWKEIDHLPKCLKEKGTIIFDDAHKEQNQYISERLKLQGLPFVKLKSYTDQYGRYPGISSHDETIFNYYFEKEKCK